MAYEIANYAVKATFVAAADLSSSQYKFVKLDSDGKVVIVSGATDRPIGVLQNAPVAGQEAEVLIVGGTKIVTGTGGLTEGAVIKTSSAGLAVATTVGTDTTHYILGTALTQTAANEYVTAVINCASAGRAA